MYAHSVHMLTNVLLQEQHVNQQTWYVAVYQHQGVPLYNTVEHLQLETPSIKNTPSNHIYISNPQQHSQLA
jgi:hypothetical protein